MEREIPLFGWQIMPYLIGSYVPTTLLYISFLYADDCDEGSEKDKKKIMGLGVREQENRLGGVG